MAERHYSAGTLLVFDHKTLFSLSAFGLIALLLLLHQKSGLRGRRAARLVLIAYLLLTLAYPGVKFVTDILMP
ncbi:MAG TPA: cytochrome c biogenesis protein CcsA, partial [Kiloniellaceae bacterium]|nr:cytochrome c biogenesis protein CcsA [Kiloniellaceae bacterium]